MADISKCVNGCAKAAMCYRWTAAGSDYQSYMDFKPDENGECGGFWDNSDREQER